MKLLAITCGTEGDARPIAALGHALIGAGHEVTLLADASTLDTAHGLGVPAEALAGDIRATITRDGGMRDITGALAKLTIANTGAWLDQALATGRGCDAVIVSGLAGFVGLSAAQALGVPAIGAMLIPLTPTAAFASPFLPFTPPRAFNRGSHQLFAQLSWQVFRPATNRARARIGLPPLRGRWTARPALYGVSPALLPHPGDWPDNAHLCGQWVAPAPAWTPPDALLAFLDAGEPPIYIGFGSMGGFDSARILASIVGAVGQRRALFHAGWSGLDATRLPGNFHSIGRTPHDWLLPRTAMAIHHGGSGTTHSACRAGVPSVIVPFAGDQFFWAARMRALGIARDALKGRSLDAARLARAIAYADTGPARAAAASIGRRMRDEDGLARAVALVERHVAAGRMAATSATRPVPRGAPNR